MEKGRVSYFQEVTPESVGIASAGILDFLKDVERKGIEQHSLMVIRHGKCCAAGWWKPYAPEYLHPLYSFSKSLTATAIGFARQEGILSLEERLVDLFPDKLPEEVSENLKEATLHDLLIMGCGHETEIEWMEEDWMRAFLSHPFLHRPGTFYKYNTPGTNMLAAALKRKTGQDVTEYLRPRLLDPLGIREITCAKLPGPEQVELGGAGMKLRTEDMAKFACFLLGKGKWEGKQLLEEEWFDLACTKRIETAGDSEGHIKEWANGYGYQCWMGSLPGSFRADGAYGQFGFVYPSLDLVVVMTTATEQTQSLIDSMMEFLIPAVSDSTLPESADYAELEKRLDSLQLHNRIHSDCCPAMEEQLTGQIYCTTAQSPDEGCSPLESLIGGAGIFSQEGGEISQMSFACEADRLIWSVWENGQKKELIASFGEEPFICEAGGIVYAANAGWRSYQALELEIRRVDALSGVRLLFRFEGDTVTLEADDTLISASGLGIRTRHTVPFRKKESGGLLCTTNA